MVVECGCELFEEDERCGVCGCCADCCGVCGCCADCCTCDLNDFDADEVGLDPEEPYDA